MEIRRYREDDRASLFALLVEEGDEWSEYHGASGRDRYARALASSTTYVACDGSAVCGYVRCRGDDGFGVYVHDLLVRPSRRGQGLGRALLERVREDAAGEPVYVMSDVDPYYEGLGYRREGSIFVVRATGDVPETR
nr:GNAT family N-acetyltransferase [uncultured Actinotalea sp.]